MKQARFKCPFLSLSVYGHVTPGTLVAIIGAR